MSHTGLKRGQGLGGLEISFQREAAKVVLALPESRGAGSLGLRWHDCCNMLMTKHSQSWGRVQVVWILLDGAGVGVC